MLEPLDAFRIAEYLHRRGAAIEGTDEMLELYAEPEMLVGYPIFTIKTDGNDNACVFLQDGRCDVYEARPHVCRVYPFSVTPGSRGKDFQYLLCEERPHHFGRGLVSVKDWMAENFSKETRAYLRAQSYWLPKAKEKDMRENVNRKHYNRSGSSTANALREQTKHCVSLNRRYLNRKVRRCKEIPMRGSGYKKIGHVSAMFKYSCDCNYIRVEDEKMHGLMYSGELDMAAE